ncbi:PWWP domain protein [Quillaja saponaria]|uniref:PWWP domain protein n=1 Tax=Quillaja saponaria TaxID=32244 RepID=A0AAD7PZX2_QUISA|nr:PWWP domain protein [Quillaja saponaria]
MAKRRTLQRKKSQKINEIDNIPQYTSQPRSSPPKRRTDFSIFFSHSSSLSNSGSLLGSSYGEVTLSNVTISSLQGGNTEEIELPECSLVQCSRKSCKEKAHTVGVSESTLDRSHVTDSNGLAIAPGSVVWAKTDCQMWWPSEIMGESFTSADQGNDGHVLVQFYGNRSCAWVDPTKDISEFNDSFEEKSCNPLEDFQEALKQALQRKDHLSSCRELFDSPDIHSCQQDHSSDKLASSTSSRSVDDNILERRRGKRARTCKVRFDEVTFPQKSERKFRRFKIMRYLGLTAPFGSPFLQ